MQRFVRGFALALAILIFVASGNVLAQGEKVNLRIVSFWTDTRFPDWVASVDEFNAMHPHIHATLEMSGGAGSTERMSTLMLSQNPPDVIQLWKYLHNAYVDAGELVELTPYMERDGWLENDHLYPPFLDWVSPDFDGKYYGLADFPGPSVFFYNVKLFEELGLEPPTTFEELIETGKIVKDLGYIPLLGDWQSNNILDPISKIQAQTAGIQPVLDAVAGESSLVTEPLIKAVTLFKEMIDAGLITPDTLAFDGVAAASAFVSGQVAMYSDKSHVVNNIDPIKPEGFEYDIFNVKFVEDPVTMYTATFGAIWAIPAKSNHHDEAWEFMRWMWSKEWQEQYMVGNGQLSSVQAANENIDHPITKKVADEIMPTLNRDSFYLIDILPQPVIAELSNRLHELVLGVIEDPVEVLELAQRALEEWQSQRN